MVNGALIQVIMASRVLYGLAVERGRPRLLARIEPATGTPVVATLVVTSFILVLALAFPLVKLAEATSVAVSTGFLIFEAIRLLA